jgi:hypothetical protein
VIGLATLAAVGAVTPRRIGQAARKGKRLRRAAASGAAVVNPSAGRTHGRQA